MQKTIFQILKAALAAIIISLALSLIFTLFIQLCSLPTKVIKPVNQVFKILSVVGGGLLFIRGDKGLIKGGIYGLLAIVCTYFLYAAISHSINFSWKFLLELLLGVVAGAVTGVIAVNIKKRA